MTAIAIDFSAVARFTDEQFYQLCRDNPDIKFERTARGEIVVMAPTGGETGNRNCEISADFVFWNRQTQLGYCFDSSTCFRLPGGSDRSPDAAWIAKSRWEALKPAQREKFPPIAPDFVLELLSPSDSLAATQAKMREYLAGGVRLGWLLNRQGQNVEIWRSQQQVEILQRPQNLSGEDVLPGLILDLQAFWS